MAVNEILLAGPYGPLRIRIHLPALPSVAGLVWAHGGSFVGGDLDMPESEQVARELADRRIVVVSVDYQLGPVSPWWATELGVPVRDGAVYPVPQHELMFALNWARTAGLGPPAGGWSLGGASAGASLAASAALLLRDAGNSPRSIVLVYPTVHGKLPPPSSSLQEAMIGVDEFRRFPPDRMREMNENHAGGELDACRSRAFAGGQNLKGLPRVLIVNSEHDDLRASGEAFASELADAGVDVKVVMEPGTFHGHLNDELSPQALRTIETISGWLKS